MLQMNILRVCMCWLFWNLLMLKSMRLRLSTSSVIKQKNILIAFFGFLKTNYVIQQQQNTEIHASPAFVFNFSFHV